MKQLDQALRMLSLLQSGQTLSISQLSAMLEIHPRSVRRLRDVLGDNGYTIVSIHGPGGGYRLDFSQVIPIHDFTANERQNILRGLSILLNNYSRFGLDFIASIGKLSAAMRNQNLRVLSISTTVKPNIDMQVYHDYLDKIEKAIQEHRYLQIDYGKSPKDKRSYHFRPYELFVVNQEFYLKGFDQNGRIIDLKVLRIKKLILEEKEFDPQAKALPRNTGDFGFVLKPVDLEVIVSSAFHISEYIWGDNQEIKWLNDEDFLLKVRFANAYAAQNFLLQYANVLEIISPSHLKTWLFDRLSEALAKHR